MPAQLVGYSSHTIIRYSAHNLFAAAILILVLTQGWLNYFSLLLAPSCPFIVQEDWSNERS